MVTNDQVVGWPFKDMRFQLHAKCLGFAPPTYVGVGLPVDAESAVAGEQKTLQAFEQDEFGNMSSLLEKRRSRNPFNRKHSYGENWCEKLVW